MAWLGAWPTLEIQNLQKSLADVVVLVAQPARDQPDEVSRALARFLIVRMCGYLEQIVDKTCTAYIDTKSAPAVARFARSSFGRGMNPTPEKLIALVKKFDQAWSDELQALFEEQDQRLHREINLLVDRRNKIAHGLSESLGARKALDLIPLTHQVADWFIARFDPR